MEILLTEKELSCFLTRVIFSAFFKTFVMTIEMLSDLAERLVIQFSWLLTLWNYFFFNFDVLITSSNIYINLCPYFLL